jgi:hypothetical protein
VFQYVTGESAAGAPGTEVAVMVTVLAIIGLVILFDLAAWRWGVDSRDGFASPEWDRRREWFGPRYGKKPMLDVDDSG